MLPDLTEGLISGPVDPSTGPPVLDEVVSDDSSLEGAESDTSAGDSVEPIIQTTEEDFVPRTLSQDAPVPKADRVRWEFRCKICQLATKLPTVYEMLHKLVLRDKRSYNSSIAEVNAYIHQHRLRVHPLNMVNILKHFKAHIGIETQAQLAISRQNINNAPPMAALAATQGIMPLINEAVGDDADDFNNLNELRVRITNVLRRLESQLDIIDQDGIRRLDKFAVSSFVALTSETRACINDISKMRQSERLLNTVVQSLLDKLTFAIIPQLMEEYKVVVTELRAAGVPEDAVIRVDLRLRTKMAEIIGTTARAAVSEVQRDFKIR